MTVNFNPKKAPLSLQKVETKEGSGQKEASVRTDRLAQEHFGTDSPLSRGSPARSLSSSQGSPRGSFHSDSGGERRSSLREHVRPTERYQRPVHFSSVPRLSEKEATNFIRQIKTASLQAIANQKSWSDVCANYELFDDTCALEALRAFQILHNSIGKNGEKVQYLFDNKRLLVQIAQHYLYISENHQDLSEILSLSTSFELFGEDPALIRAVTHKIETIEEALPQLVVSALKAYASLYISQKRLSQPERTTDFDQLIGVRNHGKFFQRLVEQLIGNAPSEDFPNTSIKDLVSICHSLSELPIKREKIEFFLCRAGSFLSTKNEELSVAFMIDIANSYATMRQDHVDLFNCIEQRLLEDDKTINNLSVEKLIQITASFASLKAMSSPFLSALVSSAHKKIDNASKNLLACLALNFAENNKILDGQLRLDPSADTKCQDFFSALATTPLAKFSSSGLVHLAHSFAKIYFANESFFKSLGNYATQNAQLFSSTELALLAYCFTQLDFTHTPLFRLITQNIKCEELPSIHLSNLLLSFAMSDQVYSDIKRFFDYAETIADRIQNEAHGSHLLYTIYHALCYFEAQEKTPFQTNFKKLNFEIGCALQTIARTPPKTSQLHKNISQAIKSLQGAEDLQFRDEYFASGYFLDIAVPQKRVGIEINGTAVHKRKLARALVRETILKHHGWTLFVITEEEWRMHKTAQQQTAFLSDLLRKIKQIPSQPRAESKVN